jgi:hypothetical protein
MSAKPPLNRDIAECKSLAEAAGADSRGTGAGRAARNTVGGAVVGSAGAGSAIGVASGATAGLIRSMFGRSGPDPAHQSFVDRCLPERGRLGLIVLSSSSDRDFFQSTFFAPLVTASAPPVDRACSGSP